MKRAGPVSGYAVLARQYFESYNLPVMLTGTNIGKAENVTLREVNGKENPVGLYNLKRQPQAVRDAYRDLIDEWRDQMPMDVQYG